MQISFVEIQGFRKLSSIRIDFGPTTTLFVGANNSGKTSAMDALSGFLVKREFSTNDFTLSNWIAIDKIGEKWRADAATPPPFPPAEQKWDALVPTLDVWLEVAADEIHYARPLIPTLDWNIGALGVRLRFEPKKLEDLKAHFLAAAGTASETKAEGSKKAAGKEYTLSLWPTCLRAFLDRQLTSEFTIKTYLLDPSQRKAPKDGIASPQELPAGSEPIEGNPLSRLIQIREIGAQRGFGTETATDSDEEKSTSRKQGQLSEQLKSYYKRHLDPDEHPEPSDLDALEAIEGAQKAYDLRLTDGFASAMKELQGLNYPGVTDPVLKIATRLRMVDGLSHSAAVQYEVISPSGKLKTQSLTLPEQYNGLGYQNLISMVFKLMSFRDGWMRVGKASKTASTDSAEHFIPPLLLVLVEEPEAHLHVQVQQVFVRKAYEVLRNHPDLKANKQLHTQLVVSTHSSHVAHECEFAWLRYFRRLPPKDSQSVPTSAVINLSEVFGPGDETARFAERYLLSTHCELFFADAAILVEGAAERMLIPHLLKHKYEALHRSFVTLLEISGSHAFRLSALIEKLGLTTLIITDLDSVDPANSRKGTPPKRGAKLVTSNSTLKEWHPKKEAIDDLLGLDAKGKVKRYPLPLFEVRIAYQIPVNIDFKGSTAEVLARTFEDSLVIENMELFKEMAKSGTAKKFNDAVAAATDVGALCPALFEVVDKCDKAAFALDVLWLCEPAKLTVPHYIREGLQWLTEQLNREAVAVLGAPEQAKAEA